MNLEPGWSNDDGALVYVSLKGGNQNLWAIDLDRKRPRQLTNGRLGSVAPRVGRNGDIIFSSASHQTDLYLQDLAGGNQRRLTQHTEDNFVPKISPDGTRAAYMSSRTGNAEIWILDLAGGGERQLTSNSDEDYSPVWSPDGTMILYVSVHGGRPALWIADASGGAPRRFLEAGPSQQSGPRWSPDGAVIGFLTPGETGNELWFTDPDGGEPHKVMGGVGEYDFYRDSRHVIYTPSTQGVALEMRARDLDSEAETILINEPHRELEVAPDGSAVSYLSSTSHFNMNLFVLRLTPTHVPDGLPLVMSKPERVTEGKGLWHVHNGGWSSDAKQVIYTRDTDAGDILLMTGAF
jgi:Tol biopolymer transport system component